MKIKIGKLNSGSRAPGGHKSTFKKREKREQRKRICGICQKSALVHLACPVTLWAPKIFTTFYFLLSGWVQNMRVDEIVERINDFLLLADYNMIWPKYITFSFLTRSLYFHFSASYAFSALSAWFVCVELIAILEGSARWHDSSWTTNKLPAVRVIIMMTFYSSKSYTNNKGSGKISRRVQIDVAPNYLIKLLKSR